MKGYELIKFNEREFDFVKVVNDLFNASELENVHELTTEEYKEQFQVGKDSSTVFHTQFYDKLRSGWPELISVYESFIKDFISPRVKEDFLYQKTPTFRVHLPGNIAVGAFHKDADFNHPAGEMNYIIPLTDSSDTASVWVESETDKGDFFPMILKVGYLVKFYGNQLTHGNKMNETSKTRVSMDFRILPLSKYNENNDAGSVTLGTKFTEGAYYKLFKK